MMYLHMLLYMCLHVDHELTGASLEIMQVRGPGEAEAKASPQIARVDLCG